MSGAAMEIIEESQPSDLHPTPPKASPNQSSATAEDLPESGSRRRTTPATGIIPSSDVEDEPLLLLPPPAQTGSCSHGNTCRYAHNEAELRPRPDKSWDSTLDRAKKLKSETEAAAAAENEEYLATGVDKSLLDKCLIGFPRNWVSDKLKSFLDE